MYTRRKAVRVHPSQPVLPQVFYCTHLQTRRRAKKIKCRPRKRACHKNNRCADVKNSPGPFRLSSHRLDDCEIFRFHFLNRSRRCLHQWNVFIGAPFFVFSVRRPNCSRIFAKAYEDLLHVQNKNSAIRLSEGKTGKPLSSLPSSVVVATFREDTQLRTHVY